jgi:NAD(P)-dependent dehydrogenase (short-subunit alcohol dehydrogenase family)
MPTDPTTAGPTPPQPSQPQAQPGSDAELTPNADHGEESYRGHDRLRGKVALITGGDSGIGRAVAIAFAREGADVLVSYLNEDEDAAETRRLVEAAGRRCVTVAGDIADEAQCDALVQRCVQELGGLDVLVNNAAYQTTHDSLAEFTTAEFDRAFKTNVYAMFWLCRAALPHLKPGASIINTTSVQAYSPDAMLAPYAATKAAIRNFTQSLAQGLADKGVRVNAVAPGPVWTPLIPSTRPRR